MKPSTTMIKNYRSGSRDYLIRARQLLNSGETAALFYAALELRCGIEARMQEYLEIAEDISEKRKQGWRIAELGKDLGKAFRLGDKIVQLILVNAASGKRCKIYHTPVTARLRKQGQQLGSYLHAMKVYRKPDDPCWTSLKVLLEETCEELAVATKGTLLGPPLLHSNRKTFKMHHELEVDPHADEVMREIGRTREDVIVKVEYLDKLPADRTHEPT